MKKYYPLFSKLSGKLFGAQSLAQSASRVEEIAPGEIPPLPPVAMDESQREKVTRAEARTSLAAEWQKIEGRPENRNGPSTRYEFDNVLATPDGFFSPRYSHNKWGKLDFSALLKGEIAEVEQGFHGLRSIGARYFGHWVMDCLPTTKLRRPEESLFFPTPENWPHALAYEKVFGLEPLAHDYVFFRKMAFCDDIGKNSHLGARLQALRGEVHAYCGATGGKKVYLRRGATGVARTITNEDELTEALAAQGYEIVDAQADLDTILAACTRASIVISMEGSHFANCMLPADADTRFVIINPADRFCNVWSDYLGVMGGHMGTVIAAKDGDGYFVDIAHLLDFSERMLAG